VVHLISKEVFGRSGVVNREINQTLELMKDQPIGRTYAIFLRLENIRPPAELLHIQYLDYFSMGWQDKLAYAVCKRTHQSVGASASPEKTTVAEDSAAAFSRADSSVSGKFFSVSCSYPQYFGAGTYWDSVNACIKAEALGGFVKAVANYNNFDQQQLEFVRKHDQHLEWGLNITEFYRLNDFVSVRLAIYDWQGGAHPSYGIRSLNFLGSGFGRCSIQELLGYSEANASRVLKYCKRVLIAMFDGDGIDDYIHHAFDDPDYTWALISQFNFDYKGLTVNFSPYDVLPFAFGSHEVLVPWRVARPLLDTPFHNLETKLLLAE
jgi:hypothetical protein